ncbi:WD40 repeat domain-containing protein [Kitasatospora sp. NPDC096147]|uniref:WD40 repeat domain-containing protein n=1 Tax=Kitasatospora sp. NPDC096147 TaxID=3364093 RepID=UPI0037F74B44
MARTTERAVRRAARRAVVALLAVLLVAGPAVGPAAAAEGSRREFTVRDERITESSGLTASQRHPGVYWTHNDSDDGPYVYGVDAATGRTVATLTLRGVKPRDVEAIALGPEGRLYLADIGDNLHGKWPEVWLYAFEEPARLADQTVQVTKYRVRYADGPRDAEALLVHPVTGRVYIASKDQREGHLYEGPESLSSTAVNVFRPVGDVPWVTDGAFSPDGRRVVLRGYFWAKLYDWTGGGLGAEKSVSVPFQRQGESVTFTADGSALMFGSEGKGSEVWRVPVPGAEKSADPSATPGAQPTGSPTGTAAPSATASGSPVATVAQPGEGPNHLGALLLAAAAVGALVWWRKGRAKG